MRTQKENTLRKESNFKASKGTKNKEHKSSESSTDKLNEEEENFIRKINKGFHKYKGKLLFKCFNHGRIGHFVAKCTYPKEEDSTDEKYYKRKQDKKKYKKSKVGNKKKYYKKKKILYSKEDSSSSDESDDDETKVRFMGIEIQNDVIEDENQNSKDQENYETDGEVDLEG